MVYIYSIYIYVFYTKKNLLLILITLYGMFYKIYNPLPLVKIDSVA